MSDELKVKVEELKQGDILLFSHTDDWMSKLISLITNSPVSHSAMSYYNYSEIVEETPPCAIVNLIEERKVGREITVMRLNTANEDMTKVLDIAKECVQDQEPYSFGNLVFSLIYILFKKATINLKLQRLLCTLMKYVISEIIELIDDKFCNGAHPMVCSQFVYYCYENAGEEYRLIISEFSSQKSILTQVKDYISKNKESLEPKLIKDIDTINVEDNIISEVDREALIIEIYNEFKNESSAQISENRNVLDESFVIATHEFCAVLSYIYGKNKTKELLTKSEGDLRSKVIDELSAIEEYVVTPGDLLINCNNLIKVGILED